MAKYKCSHVTVPGNKSCNREPDGYVRVKSQDRLMCRKHANENGYVLRPFNDAELIAMGKKKPAPKQSGPTSIFKSDPKKKKR